MKLDVVIEERPAVRLATVPHVGPYAGIGAAFERLHALVEGAGLARGGAAELLGIYYDDPQTTPEAKLRSDAALTVADGVALPAGLVEKRMPAGRYARARHVGPYEGLPEVWRWLYTEGLPSGGHRLRPAASFEVYRNTPGDVPPAALETDLYAPVD